MDTDEGDKMDSVLSLLKGQVARFDSVDNKLCSLTSAVDQVRGEISDIQVKYKEMQNIMQELQTLQTDAGMLHAVKKAANRCMQYCRKTHNYCK